jgi:hypothetical protein
MRNLFAFVLATSAILSACSDDDSGPSNDGGAGTGGKSATGGASSSGGKAASTGGMNSSSGGSSDAGGGPSSTGGASTGGKAGEPDAGGGMDGGMTDGGLARKFTVTLENVATAKAFTSGGIFNTPVNADAPGPITPGKKYQFTIDAGRKQKLSFATMLAATNDLFFGPNGDGIALYDEHGDPISGDVTDQIQLWDAGTEVNEEPSVGPNTVTNQSAPNTGPAENGNVVDISQVTTDHFHYPAVKDVIKVTVTHTTGTQFMVTIENVSSDSALMTSTGNRPAPMSPGVWVVSGAKDPLYTVGMKDRGLGLEHIAEDGNPAMLGAYIAANSGITYPASPGVWVVEASDKMPLFKNGTADYGDGLEHIAEDGNPTALGSKIGTVFNTPVGAGAPGPILPGSKYQFSFTASPGDALSFATMLAATNDVFFGPKDTGIALFDGDGKPLNGDVTGQVSLWDVGTEGNEEPGIGPNTVTNQLAADTGTPGEGKVQLLSQVNDGFTYPAVSSVLKVTVKSE